MHLDRQETVKSWEDTCRAPGFLTGKEAICLVGPWSARVTHPQCGLILWWNIHFFGPFSNGQATMISTTLIKFDKVVQIIAW